MHYENPDLPDDYWEPLWPGRPITESDDPLCRTGETYVNDKCQVFVYDYESPEGWPPIVNLSLKLNTRQPWNDWRDFYRIKSELCGTACWGIEVYPAQHALVDTANQYHMFVFAPGMEFPIQLSQAPVTDYSDEWKTHMENAKKGMGEGNWNLMTKLSKQREWHEHHKCDDLPAIGPVWAKRGYFINDKGLVELGEPPPQPPPPVTSMDLLSTILGATQDNPPVEENESSPPQNVRQSKTSKGKKKMSKRSRKQNRKRRKR